MAREEASGRIWSVLVLVYMLNIWSKFLGFRKDNVGGLHIYTEPTKSLKSPGKYLPTSLNPVCKNLILGAPKGVSWHSTPGPGDLSFKDKEIFFSHRLESNLGLTCSNWKAY